MQSTNDIPSSLRVPSQGEQIMISSGVTQPSTSTEIGLIPTMDSGCTEIKYDSEIPSGGTTLVPSHAIRRSTVVLKRHINLEDMKEVLRRSNRFSEVSAEQIARVKAVHEKLSSGAQFSFNYNTLLLVASVLAGLGLASNSPTTIIASMLVSPIMGPVVGIAYGATIYDWQLVRRSMRTEGLSLLFCILMGLILGVVIGPTHLGSTWPTPEMYNRCTMQNFLVAIPVAFFSGLGVAVGILDDQMSSLVGVAISASLLPPAVTAGMMWVAYGFYEANILGSGNPTWVRPTLPTVAPDPNATFPNGTYPNNTIEVELYGTNETGYIYILDDDGTSDDLEYSAKDFRTAGFIAIGLTLANIVLVAMASMIMFRLKERLPIEKIVFWEDLGVARKIYRNLAVMQESDEETATEKKLAEQSEDVSV